MNSGKFDNTTRGVIIINMIAFLKTLGNQTSFISVNRTISLPLNFINSFAIDEIPIRTRRNKVPSIISHQSRKLRLHCRFPIRIR
jgi:hypothetical protein